jgi:non-canonical purine NTP pyrophosphatase (RdgB/HAM1 family)
VLASANRGKQREFAALFGGHGIELLLQDSFGIASAAETGTTFEANALLKARHAAQASRLPALADDSGLEVDALSGRPGVYSARYAANRPQMPTIMRNCWASSQAWRWRTAGRAIAACWHSWHMNSTHRRCWRAECGRDR